jgi:hypothetical protein
MIGYLTAIGARKTTIIILGDSTIDGSTYASDVSALLNDGSQYEISDLSLWGDRCSGQKTKYEALGTLIKRDADYVFIQIGLNDIWVSGETYTDPQTRYQDLITTISSASGVRTKIVGSCVLKCKGFTDTHADPLAWTKLVALNADILAKTFIGLDLSTNVASETLSDAAGYLKSEYELFDPEDHVHENNAGREIIANSWKLLIE